MARPRRIAAIWIPGLPLQCAARDDATLRQRPVAITDGRIVLARNMRAVGQGITVGMAVAEAATHAADVLLVPDDPQAVQEIWDAALAHLDALGPVVEDAGLGEALVDVSGVGGSERLLVRRTLVGLGSLLHLTARAGVADGPFVATLAARRRAKDGDVAVIPTGAGTAFLASQPARLLPLPPAMHRELALLGVATIGGYAALRPSDVQRRFGQVGMAALTLAIGQDTRPLLPRAREHQETRTETFEPPVEEITPVLFVAKGLLDGHASVLRRAGMVAHGVELTLAFESGDPLMIAQRWGAPTIPGPAELDILRLALDARATEAARGGIPPRITAVTLALTDCAPDRGVQLPLTGGGTILRRQAVARLLTRLRALLGPESVSEAVPLDAHLPEAGWTARPYAVERIGTPVPDTIAPPQGALLPPIPGFAPCIPPQPIALTWHGEMPATFAHGGTHREIIVALGPYTADGGWWHDGAYARAYWLLLAADQSLHLVAEDRATGHWARYGVFD